MRVLFDILFISEFDLMTHRGNDVSFTEQEFPCLDVFSIISHSVYCVTSVVRSESRWHQHLQGRRLFFAASHSLSLLLHVAHRLYTGDQSHCA